MLLNEKSFRVAGDSLAWIKFQSPASREENSTCLVASYEIDNSNLVITICNDDTCRDYPGLVTYLVAKYTIETGPNLSTNCRLFSYFDNSTKDGEWIGNLKDHSEFELHGLEILEKSLEHLNMASETSIS